MFASAKDKDTFKYIGHFTFDEMAIYFYIYVVSLPTVNVPECLKHTIAHFIKFKLL